MLRHGAGAQKITRQGDRLGQQWIDEVAVIFARPLMPIRHGFRLERLLAGPRAAIMALAVPRDGPVYSHQHGKMPGGTLFDSPAELFQDESPLSENGVTHMGISRSVGTFMTLVFLLVFFPSRGGALPGEMWTYKALTATSDFVCIGTVRSSVLRENKDFLPEFLDEFESEITVRAVLKGDPSLERVKFVHFKYKEGVGGLGNGPTFPDIDYRLKDTSIRGDDGRDVRNEKRKDGFFIFFLKRRADGRFEPVSGNDDAGASVARVYGHADET